MARTRTGKQREARRSSPSQSPDNSRIPQVDMLKGLAVIAVILIHTFSSNLLTVIGAPFWLWQAVPIFLLLAAFTGALSYRRHHKHSLADCYDPSVIIRRYKRILFPFVIIWIVQVIVILYLWPPGLPLYSPDASLVHAGIAGIIGFFFTGASGPGNYFIPVIMTQILILPFFYWLALRITPDKMLFTTFIADVALQYILYIASVPELSAAFSYLNFVLLAALGIWLAHQERRQMALVILAGLLSLAYIAAVYYFRFQLWFISPSSGFFNEFSYFWTLILILCGLRYLPSLPLSKPAVFIKDLGKASWHIFLVQMTVIAFLNYAIVMYLRSVIPGAGMPEVLTRQLVNTLLTLVLCLSIGYGFYRAEETVKKRVRPILPADR
jgi:peptidoglycan/LPS O-acetylase OafA/YrhL